MTQNKNSPRSVRKPWSAEEDEALKALVSLSPKKDWKIISLELRETDSNYQRSSKQCRERWVNHLDPCLRKDDWTNEDRYKLFELYQTYGSSWSKIVSHLPGRSEMSAKNIFYSSLRRQFNRWKSYEPTKYHINKYMQTLIDQTIDNLKKKLKINQPKAKRKTNTDKKEKLDNFTFGESLSDYLFHNLIVDQSNPPSNDN